jgi:hypothetical protein
VWRLDRWGRSVTDLLATLQELEHLGVGFVSLTEAQAPPVKHTVKRSAEFLGESDKKPFRPPDVAEPIRIFILDYFTDEFSAALAEPFNRLVDVVHGEHDAEVA